MSTPSEQPGNASAFDGRSSDGRSAASRRVRVTFGARGLLVEDETKARSEWPFAALVTAVPLAAGARDALLSVQPPAAAVTTPDALAPSDTGAPAPGATLFVADAAFVRELRVRAPHLTAVRARWRFLKPGLWVSGAAAALVAIVMLTGISPSRTVASLLPRKAWGSVGEHVITSLFPERRTCIAPAGRAALEKLTQRLTAAPGRREPFFVTVLDSPILNAFAVPGRRIVLTRKLLATVGSAEELAGVVAHEMGHGIEQHPEASIVRVLGLYTLTKLMMSGGGDALANIGVLLAQLSYTREAEREADAHAVRILREARVPATGLVSFFERIKREGRPSGPGLPGADILSTHPSLDERIATVAKSPAWPTEPIMTADEFRALATICGETK